MVSGVWKRRKAMIDERTLMDLPEKEFLERCSDTALIVSYYFLQQQDLRVSTFNHNKRGWEVNGDRLREANNKKRMAIRAFMAVPIVPLVVRRGKR